MYASHTEVTSDRSRSEIERTLRRYGASAFAYAWTRDGTARIDFTVADREVKMTLPMPNPEDYRLTPTGRERSPSAFEQEYDAATRAHWRALALVIKAKFAAIDAGISTIEREFLADVIVDPADGRTVYELVAPRIEQNYRELTA